MLHYLRKRHQDLGRGIIMLLVAVWLSLAFQPCVMAGVQSPDMLPCNACPEQMMENDACPPGASCAVMDERGAATASDFTRPTPPSALPLVFWGLASDLPTAPIQPTALTSSPFDTPPLLRFCILLI